MQVQTRSAAPAAEAFVERFAAVWADPSPERLDTLLEDDVTLVQPLARTMRGRAQAMAMWRRLFRMSPDLRGEVLDWSAISGDELFIRIRLGGTLLRRRAEWVAVDRIQLGASGRVRERISYFDPLDIATSWLRVT